MLRKNVIQVFEHDSLYYDEASPFTERHWKALCHYLHQASRRGTAFFQIIHKGIRFSQYVGVIQAGNLTIEVLPKTDRPGYKPEVNSEQETKQQWHTMLLQMLVECKWLTTYSAGAAILHLQRQSTLLDIYLLSFLTSIEALLHEGLAKQYLQEESTQSVLKGRLLFNRQVVKNNIHQEQFYTSSSAYGTGSVFNRILHKALQKVQQISTSAAVQHVTGNLLLSFPEVQPVTISENTFRQLRYDRKTERYRPAMQYAEMLLLHTGPTIIGGQVQTLAILFDMNLLWEEWVYRQLKREEAAFGVTIHRQQSVAFWQGELLPVHKSIRPDIVIKTADESTIIIDTKWKLPVNRKPNDADLKQLFVYNLYWQSRQGILLYPATDEEYSLQGHYLPIPQLGGAGMNCRMMIQTIFRQGRLDTDFGKRILEMIFSNA